MSIVLRGTHKTTPRHQKETDQASIYSNGVSPFVRCRGRIAGNTLPVKNAACYSGPMNLKVTDRDREVFAALEKLPLTTEQLLRFSETFNEPFYNQRIVERRLDRLATSGFLRCCYYAFPRKGRNPSYWRLRPKAYRLVQTKSSPPKRSKFQPIGVSDHFHAYHVNEVVSQAMLSTHAAGIEVSEFSVEQKLAINDEQSVVPDATLGVLANQGRPTGSS